MLWYGKAAIKVILGCWSKIYQDPDFDEYLRSFEARALNGWVFHYAAHLPMPRFERGIYASVPVSDVDGVIAAMNSLIAETRDRVLAAAAGDA